MEERASATALSTMMMSPHMRALYECPACPSRKNSRCKSLGATCGDITKHNQTRQFLSRTTTSRAILQVPGLRHTSSPLSLPRHAVSPLTTLLALTTQTTLPRRSFRAPPSAYIDE
jgi:hypothetical protein